MTQASLSVSFQVQSQVLTTRKKVTTTVEREMTGGQTDRTQNVKETIERQTREFDDELGQVENKYGRSVQSHPRNSKSGEQSTSLKCGNFYHRTIRN